MQYFRDFSTRGRGTRQGLQYSRRPQGQHQHQHKKTRVDFQGVTVVSVGVVAGGLMIWLGNQDAAPYTNRKRFMLVDRGTTESPKSTRHSRQYLTRITTGTVHSRLPEHIRSSEKEHFRADCVFGPGIMMWAEVGCPRNLFVKVFSWNMRFALLSLCVCPCVSRWVSVERGVSFDVDFSQEAIRFRYTTQDASGAAGDGRVANN